MQSHNGVDSTPQKDQRHASTHILLAAHDRLMRLGLRSILETESGFAVVAEAGTGLEAVEAANQCQPEVAILAVRLTEMNGFDAATQITKSCPGAAVLMLSMFADERHVRRAARCGARGYVLKDSEKEELIEGVRRVSRGLVFASAPVRDVFEDAFKSRRMPDSPDRFDLLTDRERRVHQLIVEGRTTKEIAKELGSSVHTIETHRWRTMSKLGLHTLAELVLDAVRRGVIR